MILLIDNFDSFTYNLFQLVTGLGYRCVVKRNNEADIALIERLKPDVILLSPGPGAPIDAGHCIDVVKHFAGRIPIFGVCLGHQIIGEAFGGKIVRAPKMMHGKCSMVSHNKRGTYANVSSPFQVTRYHSLMIERKSLPPCLQVTSQSTDDKLIMGVRHKKHAIEGVQFHPESYATLQGPQLLKNFLSSVMQ